MGLMTDLTFIHMQAFTAVDQIERGLKRIRYEREDPESLRRAIDQTTSHTLRLRRDLDHFFRREEEELFPLVQRIFGAEIPEITKLARYQPVVLGTLDHFIFELTEAGEGELSANQIHLTYLELLFEEFIDRYQERCAVERSFYESYSTILFPGGVSTD